MRKVVYRSASPWLRLALNMIPVLEAPDVARVRMSKMTRVASLLSRRVCRAIDPEHNACLTVGPANAYPLNNM